MATFTWTREALDKAVALIKASSSPVEALSRVQATLGSTITHQALRKALVRHKRGKFWELLGKDVAKPGWAQPRKPRTLLEIRDIAKATNPPSAMASAESVGFDSRAFEGKLAGVVNLRTELPAVWVDPEDPDRWPSVKKFDAMQEHIADFEAGRVPMLDLRHALPDPLPDDYDPWVNDYSAEDELIDEEFGPYDVRPIGNVEVDDTCCRAVSPPEYLDEQSGKADPFAVTDSLLEVYLIVPDTHVPYHDVRAWNLMLRVARSLQLSGIYILGDFADFYSVSRYNKDPTWQNQLRGETKAVRAALAELDALGVKKKVYICGNHEDRLPNYLMDKAPALYSSMTIEGELGLKKSGWEYLEYGQHAKLGKLYLTHDTGAGGAGAHLKSYDAFHHSVVIGHCHRMAVTYMASVLGERHVAASLGWLGDPDKIKYEKEAKKRFWSLGFGLAYLEKATGNVHLQPVPIVDYRCAVEGKLYVG